HLTLGQAVDMVVHHDVRDVGISAYRVNEVAHPDGKPVTIAAHSQHRQVPVRQLDSRGRRQRPPVDHVEVVGVDVVPDFTRAADTGYDHHVFRTQSQIG